MGFDTRGQNNSILPISKVTAPDASKNLLEGMLVARRGAGRCLCCGVQRASPRNELRHVRYLRGKIHEKLERYQLDGGRDDAALQLELRRARKPRRSVGPTPKPITK